ncbi:MAG: LysR family transcriptional regulator [Cyanophyceae cyanobacterium]
MDRLESLQAFIQVVEAGGFAAAARRMMRSRSAVNKLVVALEQHLGVQLLYRSTRRVVPTETGRAFYEQCREILADLEAAELAASRSRQEPRGSLKINGPMSFGTLHLGPAVAEFAAIYPSLRVQVVLEDRFVDPIAEGYDVTVRIAERGWTGKSLATVAIAPVELVLCAAPSYLERHGIPEEPMALPEHNALHYGYTNTGSQWVLGGPSGEQPVAVAGNFCANNGDVLRSAAIAGLGITLLPRFLVAEAIAQGQLCPLLEAWPPRPLMLTAVYPANRHLSAKVRLFVDFLRDRFGQGFG